MINEPPNGRAVPESRRVYSQHMGEKIMGGAERPFVLPARARARVARPVFTVFKIEIEPRLVCFSCQQKTWKQVNRANLLLAVM